MRGCIGRGLSGCDLSDGGVQGSRFKVQGSKFSAVGHFLAPGRVSYGVRAGFFELALGKGG